MATIYEVAKAAGVSPKTAARVLAGDTKRSKSKEKVLKAARKLGYVRNQQAANLRSGRSNMIGVMVPHINNPFYPKFLQTLHDACRQENYQMLLGCSFGKAEEEVNCLRNFQTLRVDGLIINASEMESGQESYDVISQFLESGKPVMLSGGYDSADERADRIVIKNREATKHAVGYLVGKGHRRIGFFGGQTSNPRIQERFEGFVEGMEEAKLKVDERWNSWGDLTSSDACDRLDRMIERANDEEALPSAVLCNNDVIALGAIKACSERGIKVPNELAIVGFDDIEMASLMNPSLTTLRQPQDKIANDCVKRIMEQIKVSGLLEPIELEYKPELVVRGSA